MSSQFITLQDEVSYARVNLAPWVNNKGLQEVFGSS